MNSELQQMLHKYIPITEAMGIQVIDSDELSLSLAAPLKNNVNDKGTAFGGSLYSLMVLSGWTLIYKYFKQQNMECDIVIQQSNIEYLKPVESDFIAKASFESEAQITKVLKMFQRKGMARIKLISEIVQNGETAVSFEGSYVIHR